MKRTLILALVVLAGCSRPSEVVKRPLPITVAHRKAKVGDTEVIQIRNDSQKHITFFVTLAKPWSHKTNTFVVSLKPGEIHEIGHAQGWNGETGDEFKADGNGWIDFVAKLP